MENDQSREGITLSKILQFFRLFSPKNTKTLARLNKFTDLDLKEIYKLTGVKIKGIILDIDGCVSFNHGKILDKNVEYINQLASGGIKIVIYSNMKKTDRYEVLNKNIIILTNIAPKPELSGFKEACKRLNLPKKNIVMIGDNYITDGGAIRAGINFIGVKPLRRSSEDLTEKIHSAIRAMAHWISKKRGLFL